MAFHYYFFFILSKIYLRCLTFALVISPRQVVVLTMLGPGYAMLYASLYHMHARLGSAYYMLCAACYALLHCNQAGCSVAAQSCYMYAPLHTHAAMLCLCRTDAMLCYAHMPCCSLYARCHRLRTGSLQPCHATCTPC